jgi:collagenase-like PrtC family protease
MRFQAATLFSVFSLSLLSSTVALPLEGSSLAARDEAYARDVNEVYARGIDDVYARDIDEVYARDVDEVYPRDIDNTLWARAKAPKVTFALQKGKFSSKDRQTAAGQAEDALEHYGYTAGTVM